MNYEEFSTKFKSRLERRDAWLTALIGKANQLGGTFRALIEAPEAVELKGRRVPVVEVIGPDLFEPAPFSGLGLTVLPDGTAPFAVSVIFRNGSKYLRQFVCLAIRMRGGKVEYALWDAPNSVTPKEKIWVASESEILELMICELEDYYLHDHSLGKFNSSSVRYTERK